MEQFISRPFKLYNKIQHYDWGTKNENAFIPVLLGEKAQADTPYAELWIGTHPKAPSEIEYDGNKISLNQLIEKHPVKCLGSYASHKFSNQFPFLLKVLSAARALSIQTHPDKTQAQKLHAEDPKNYPDDNHKPEIAIAVDSLVAVAGFRPVGEIVENLRSLTELNNFIGKEAIEKILSSRDERDSAQYIRDLYGNIMRKAEEKESLPNCINNIRERLKNKKSLTAEEEQFLKQYELFGPDIGLLSFFFFNIIRLKPGQAIYTAAGVPHAYINGNIIECMANSDNVVRAGLTNKFKDVKTLLEIVKYDFKHYEIINSEQKTDEVTYKTGAEEFEVSSYRKPAGSKRKIKTEDKPFVCLVTGGTVEIKWELNGEKFMQKFSKGESFFVPAALAECEIFIVDTAEYFLVTIP